MSNSEQRSLGLDFGSHGDTDSGMAVVLAWWTDLSRGLERTSAVIRQGFDEVLDGPRTGRFVFEDLSAPEQEYLQTKIQILLRDEFLFPVSSGETQFDYSIAGQPVDFEFSLGDAWQIPLAATGELCLLVTASEASTRFSLGVFRCGPGPPHGTDANDLFSVAADSEEISWVWRDQPYPTNLLRELPGHDTTAIFSWAGKGNGQSRVNELFRRAQGRIIPRQCIATVARQADPMKRVRDARGHLRPEGILILGHQKEHPRIASDLDLPVPAKGEMVSQRIVPATPTRLASGRKEVVVSGQSWVVAMPGEPNLGGPASY